MAKTLPQCSSNEARDRLSHFGLALDPQLYIISCQASPVADLIRSNQSVDHHHHHLTEKEPITN